MPAFNGTGPRGLGSRTGRGFGNCSTRIANTNWMGCVRASGSSFSKSVKLKKGSLFSRKNLSLRFPY